MSENIQKEKQETIIVIPNPYHKKFLPIQKQFDFIKEYNNNLIRCFSEINQVDSQNNFYVQNEGDLIDRVKENLLEKEFGFEKENSIANYLKENLQRDFKKKKISESQVEENQEIQKLIFPDNYNDFTDDEKQQFNNKYNSSISILNEKNFNDEFLFKILLKFEFLQEVPAEILSEKLQNACNELNFEEKPKLSNSQLKAQIYEMKIFITNYANVIRLNRGIFNHFSLIDNMFPLVSGEIQNVQKKMFDIEKNLKSHTEIENYKTLSFDFKKIIKQIEGLNDKVKQVQLNFPFSEEQFYQYHSLFPIHQNNSLSYLEKQLRNQRKNLKNLQKTSEIILKGDFSQLETRHVQEFGISFLNKFGEENNKLNEILISLFNHRENYIKQINEQFGELMKNFQIKKKVLDSYIYMQTQNADIKQENENLLSDIEKTLQKNWQSNIDIRDVQAALKKIEKINENFIWMIYMSSNKQTKIEIFNNYDILQSFKQNVQSISEIQLKLLTYKKQLLFFEKYLVDMKDYSRASKHIKLFSHHGASQEDFLKFNQELNNFHQLHKNLYQNILGYQNEKLEFFNQMKEQLEDDQKNLPRIMKDLLAQYNYKRLFFILNKFFDLKRNFNQILIFYKIK